MHRLPTLQRLINQLRHVPYLASKNVYRVAFHFLASDQQKVEAFCAALLEAKRAIKSCNICFNWAEGAEHCSICQNPDRTPKIVCVVETWHDLLAIERAGSYQGVYHVLGGALSPLEGIGPGNLNIAPLLDRVANNEVDELIFATNPSPEGEATASFITSKIERDDVTISKLASGMPTGSSLEYLDRITIYKALAGRVPF